MKKLMISATALALLGLPALTNDLAGKSWDEIVAQARTEGEVTWYVWHLQDALREAVKPFEAEYGIKVTIAEGTIGGHFDKVLADRMRKTGDVDVHALGFDRYEGMDLAGLYIPLDILPPDSGRAYELTGVSGQGHAVAYWGNQSGIAYDPAKVDETDLPQNAAEFAEFWAANPGKFGFNYENGGAGPSFYTNVIVNLGGWDRADGTEDVNRLMALEPAMAFFRDNGPNYVITASNADSITRLSDGELVMVSAWEDHLAGLQQRGEVRKDLEFYVPEMGMNGGGNGVGIPLNAPHPAAAAVFVNWLASAETQSMFNATFGTVPMNAAADSSKALVSPEDRANQVAAPARPFRDSVEAYFIENVILER